ncbi:hypothetical protein RRG08_024578 [Elysia crispata]|uniref:Uncharacterized protein n=1 Tax=Elysia crispata TaxID=231223 RepID=A0AAE0ZXL7_9GAST|nr:hypothetical protein RRG08_024578 [Elysia crispata]
MADAIFSSVAPYSHFGFYWLNAVLSDSGSGGENFTSSNLSPDSHYVMTLALHVKSPSLCQNPPPSPFPFHPPTQLEYQARRHTDLVTG